MGFSPERERDLSERLAAALARLGDKADIEAGASVEALDALLAWARHRGAHEIHVAPQGPIAHIRLMPGTEAISAPIGAYAALLERLQRLGELETSLHDAQAVPLALHEALIDAFEQHGYDYGDIRFPPGWFTVTAEEGPVEVSICCLPSENGPRAVLRLGAPLPAECRLDALGLGPEAHRAIESLLSERQGLILVASPPGGGKSWTLRAMLRQLLAQDALAATIESAMPYRLPGVRQLPWGDAGVSLRSATMQATFADPDVVLLDEITTADAAEEAVNLALSGPMVLAGIAAPDAVGAIVRLCEILGSPLLAAEPLRAVVAHRPDRGDGRWEVAVLDADLRGMVAADTGIGTLRMAVAEATVHG